ncbi:MAG TPA: heme lyase CcmF/NrfE family subunit [Rhizomicrobium sp.]|nr:heme lyase CcmF/NrfE family subunit [Rhizomicrobium sp.]
MTAEIGQYSLILAFLIALVQTAACLLGAALRDRALMALGRTASLLQLAFVAGAFGALAVCYLNNDFSVALVAEHSNSTQPLIYRLAATWGSHEGSMVLWVLILSVYSAALAIFGTRLRESLQARVLGVQALIASAFLGFSLFTSNPFMRADPAPVDGSELNPLLQDPGLVFHPPILYLGYVGFSMAFAFGIAALIEGRVDAGWARWIRPWVLASWICLTIGIMGGSVWAYYTLGWGGWWFWDPVENASLMPWLMGTALLHSTLALERRGALVSWTILLAILTFSMSLIGTFLVRSGVLTSVHAFAVDPQRGVYILGIIGGVTGTALGLFALRFPAMKSGAMFKLLSREAGITINNVFLLGLTAIVFLGTFWPIFVELTSKDRISVGPPYYHALFVPIAAILLLLVSFGPMLNWKRSDGWDVLWRLRWPISIACATFVFAAIVFGIANVVAACGFALGVFLILGALAVLASRWRVGRERKTDFVRIVLATPLPVWGMVLAHAGLGVLTIGITAMSTFQTNKVLQMTPGQAIDLAGYRVTLDSIASVQGPNYQADRAFFSVESTFGSRELVSERRLYPASQTPMTKAGIGVSLFGNTYISVGDRGNDGSITVRMWDHPFVDWIWAGGVLMALGGMISLADRRVRVGAAKRAEVPAAAAATP